MYVPVGEQCQKLYVCQHQEGAGGPPNYQKEVPLLTYEVFQASGGRLAGDQ